RASSQHDPRLGRDHRPRTRSRRSARLARDAARRRWPLQGAHHHRMSTAVVTTTSSERNLGSSEVMTSLVKIFGAACDQLRVEGAEPLLLVDPAFVYVTQNPQHQLFSVAIKDGVAAGRREHVALIKEGQLLMALAPSPEELEPTGFLLSG